MKWNPTICSVDLGSVSMMILDMQHFWRVKVMESWMVIAT